jgi:glycosyltransferase involved in cell wall biosynthesis
VIWSDNGPRISCVMVTANRAAIARRAVSCFLDQSWSNRELVIVDDGSEDYAPIVSSIPADRLIHQRIGKSSGNTLGKLRNLSLDLARGDLVAQWDDDDWYHPDRLKRQAEALTGGKRACVLAATLMHLDAPEWMDRPYIGSLNPGVPGTILHRADATARYPEERRGEDTVFLDHWSREQLAVIDAPHLFLRAFHGSNTWERAHFERRVRNTLPSAVEYGLRKLTGTLSGHSRFRLPPEAGRAFEAYREQSRALGLLP